ncbi:hypothetical protein SNL152K_10188 [Streptomyces sp. NL15-2K]|nr:hypothetical protein SNL152K_10188 [Streptomyces sp. NL15-2K]
MTWWCVSGREGGHGGRVGRFYGATGHDEVSMRKVKGMGGSVVRSRTAASLELVT